MNKIISYINETGVNHCLCPIKDGCSCENWWIIDTEDYLDVEELFMDQRKNPFVEQANHIIAAAAALDADFPVVDIDTDGLGGIVDEWELFIRRVEELAKLYDNTLPTSGMTSDLGEWKPLGTNCTKCGKEIYTKDHINQGFEHNCGCGTVFFHID